MKKIIAIISLMASLSYATTNEISVQMYIKADKNSSQIERKPGTMQVQWAGTKYFTGVYSLTTNLTIMGSGQVASMGWAYLRHLGTSNLVQISMNNGVTTNMTLKAGESSLFRLNTGYAATNITAASNMGAIDFEATFIEN